MPLPAYHNCFHLSRSQSFSFWGYTDRMNVRHAPSVPGNTESERMDNAVRKIFTVSKEEMQRREAAWQKEKDNVNRPKG